MTDNEGKTPGVKTLSVRSRLVASLLAQGRTRVECAAEIGKSETTVDRIIANPAVRKEVESMRNAAIEAGLGILATCFRSAALTLAELARTGKPSDSIRLGASRAIVEATLKVREQCDLFARVEKLEANAALAPGGLRP